LLKQFAIQFASLKPGMYDFKFDINEKFFDHFEESEVKHGKLNVLVELNKQPRMFILNFKITGTVKLICDRCLDDFDLDIDTENRLIVKISNDTKEETDEIISISESEHSINAAQYIYEFIHLALPSKRTHPENKKGKSGCNKDVLKKLEEHKSKENIKTEIDPRWESLKKIKFN